MLYLWQSFDILVTLRQEFERWVSSLMHNVMKVLTVCQDFLVDDVLQLYIVHL